jgi:apolipoprotein D and lipocalin family protein
VAFTVALRQNKALIGDNGITPCRNVLNQAQEYGQFKQQQRLAWRNNETKTTTKTRRRQQPPPGTSKLPPLQVASGCDTAKFMGKWFVIAVKPTMFEKTNSNAIENYTWYDGKDGKKMKNYDIDIDFQFNNEAPLTSPMKSMPQKGWIQGEDKTNSALWKVSPFWPVKMPYQILEVDETNYEYTVIGYPSRDYCWIMGRHPVMPEETYNMLTDKLVNKHQYSLEGLRKVPQVWTAVEREKRGLTVKEIPDSMLQTEATK